MTSYSLEIGGAPRRFLLDVPPRPRALVVFLHGKGSTAEWADGETAWSSCARKEGFALALPEALPPRPDQPPRFLGNPPQWNDGSVFRPDDNSAQLDDISYLTAVVDEALSRSGVVPEKVFMAGFSNGAGMTFRYAAQRADRVAAIAPIAGLCWIANPHPSRPVPTLYMVGSADPLVPLRGGSLRSPWTDRLVLRPPVSETLDTWARAIGCDNSPRFESATATVRMDIYPGPVTFRSVTIEGLGHHWPGGKGQLNQRIAGPPSDTLNATEFVWEFFKQFV